MPRLFIYSSIYLLVVFKNNAKMVYSWIGYTAHALSRIKSTLNENLTDDSNPIDMAYRLASALQYCR